MGKLTYKKHNQCKLQVMTTTCVNYVSALVDDTMVRKKHHQRKLQKVKIILETSIGAGCSNQLQLALCGGCLLYTSDAADE